MALEREEFIERMRQPLSPLEKELVNISEGGLGKLRQSSNKPSVREISQTEEIITPNNMRGLPPSAKNVSRSPLINIANAPKTQGELDSLMAENVYSAPNKTRAGLQGLTLGGADEIEALARSTFGDESYEEAKRNIGLSYDQYVKDNPEEALSLELAGGLAPFIIASLMSGGTATPF